MGFEQHPDTHTSYRSEITKTGFDARYLCFVHTLPEDKADKNNVANREKWAKNIIKLNNCPKIQNNYQYGASPLSYKGDVTPSNEDQLPPLSEFLTIRDTMEVIRIAFTTKDKEKPEIKDLLEDDNILSLYYSQELIPKLREYFLGPKDDYDKQLQQSLPNLGGVHMPPFEFD